MHKVTRFKRQTLKWRLWLRPLFSPFIIYIQSQVRRMGRIGTFMIIALAGVLLPSPEQRGLSPSWGLPY